jgi:hypothetical protein
VNQFTAYFGEIVDKIQGVLNFMCNACRLALQVKPFFLIGLVELAWILNYQGIVFSSAVTVATASSRRIFSAFNFRERSLMIL